MRDSFVFYRSFYEALEDLPSKEFKAAALAIMQYALNDVEPTTKGVEKTVFRIAKDLIDRNNQRYENGKKGGRPRNQTETEPETLITEEKPKENQTVTDKEPNRNPNVDVDDMLLSNNINTTHACAHAREKVSISDFETAVGCEDWEKYPTGEVYAEIRDTLIELINSGQIELGDISHDVIGKMINSMYIGRDRREITNLAAYLTAIIGRSMERSKESAL